MTALVDRALGALPGLGSELAVAVSVVLAVGALCTALLRSPHERHRTAELCLAGALLVVVLLVVPLPRPLAVARPAPEAISAEGPSEGSESLATQVGTVPFLDLRGASTDAGATAGDAGPGRLEPSSPLAEIAPAEPRGEPRTGERAARRAGGRTYSVPERLAFVVLLGALGFALRSALSVASLAHLLASARAAPAWLRARADRLGVRARVVVSAEVSRPCCAGFLRGTIVLPSALALPSKGAQLEAVLLHEDAHASQRHPRARVLAALAAPLLYWNPLFWWLVRDLRQSAELVADDMAAGRWDKRRYVTELLRLVEAQSARRAPAPLGSGALDSRSEFLERMEALLMRRLPLNTKSPRSLVAVRSMGALCVLASVAAAWGRPAQDVAPEPAQPERSGVLDALLADPTLETELAGVLAALAATQVADPLLGVVRAEHETHPEPLSALAGLGYAAAGDTQPEPAPRPQARARQAIEFEFVVDDHAALGRLVTNAVAHGLHLEFRSELDTGPGGSPIRGRATVHGAEPTDLQEIFGRASLVAARKYPTKPGADALAARVAKLEALVAKLATAATASSSQERYDVNPLARDPGAAYARYFKALNSAGRHPTEAVDAGVVSGVTRDWGVALVRIDCTGPNRWRVGEHLEIHRGDRYLGSVRVIDAQDGRSLGILVMEAEGASIRTGDRALHLVSPKDKAKSKAQDKAKEKGEPESRYDDVIGLGGGAGGLYRDQ